MTQGAFFPEEIALENFSKFGVKHLKYKQNSNVTILENFLENETIASKLASIHSKEVENNRTKYT